jgi:TorA maturation chaperone TorD
MSFAEKDGSGCDDAGCDTAGCDDGAVCDTAGRDDGGCDTAGCDIDHHWLNKAALYELLALALMPTSESLADALVSGEYAETAEELALLNGISHDVASHAAGLLEAYKGRDAEEAFHALRIEHTRLYVGAPKPAVSPFAGVWWANEAGVEPLLFVNKESMAVERFMRSCGIGQPEGKNEPLDHIATELEFLQYLCIIRANPLLTPKNVTLPDGAYESFMAEHFDSWSKAFAAATIASTSEPLFEAVAGIISALPPQ